MAIKTQRFFVVVGVVMIFETPEQNKNGAENKSKISRGIVGGCLKHFLAGHVCPDQLGEMMEI